MRRVFRSFAAAVAVLAFSATAALGEPRWSRGIVDPGDDVYVGSAQEDYGISYILVGSVKTTPEGYAQVSSRFEYHSAESFNGFTFLSLLQTYSVDCRNNRTRLSARRAYARNNLAGASRDMGFPATWVDVEEGTLMETLVELACDRAGIAMPNRPSRH
ncbi:MAG: hypothetical protein U1E50_07985 [Caulobacteraceae bacterium]